MKYSGLQNFAVKSLKRALFSKNNKDLNNDFGCVNEIFEDILEVLHSESEENGECTGNLNCIIHKYFGFSYYEER